MSNRDQNRFPGLFHLMPKAIIGGKNTHTHKRTMGCQPGRIDEIIALENSDRACEREASWANG